MTNENKTSIYYYSGTGNSYLVAEYMQKAIENSKLHNLLTYSGETIKSKVLVIIFPVHMYGIPPVVLDFIDQMNISKEILIYAVCTCGGIQGETMYHMDEAIKEKDCQLAGGYVVKMPRNYTVEFKVQSKKEQLKILSAMKERVASIAEEIKLNKQTFNIRKFKISK